MLSHYHWLEKAKTFGKVNR